MSFAWVERIAITVASLALSIVLIALLSGYFSSHDAASIGSSQDRIGESFPDQGNAALRPGQAHPRYNSDPPTSGAHLRTPVIRDRTRLSADQLLSALAAGDVVVVYGTDEPPPGLVALARSVAGPFTPGIAGSGLAVILTRRSGTAGLIGLAWTRTVRVSGPEDSLLQQFMHAWLGHGARRR